MAALLSSKFVANKDEPRLSTLPWAGARWARRPVSRVLCRPCLHERDGHSSGPPIAGRFSRPTRATRASDGPTGRCPARRSYSVLLQAGLAMPFLLLGPRCALTAPFHPCRAAAPACWRGCRFGGLLSVALSLGSPPAGVARRLVAVEPGLSSLPRRRGSATVQPSGPQPHCAARCPRSSGSPLGTKRCLGAQAKQGGQSRARFAVGEAVHDAWPPVPLEGLDDAGQRRIEHA